LGSNLSSPGCWWARAALVNGLFKLHEIRANTEKEQSIQDKEHQHQVSLPTLQKDFEEKHEAQIRNQRMKEIEDEEASIRDKITSAYQNLIQNNPYIASIQILDMSFSLDTIKMYVKARIREEAKLPPVLDPTLVLAEETSDPKELFRVDLQEFTNQTGEILDLDNTIRMSSKPLRYVLLGDVGSGKTILLKKLALSYAAIKPPITDLPDLPIYVELSLFASSTQSKANDLLDFIANEWQDKYRFPKDDALICISKKLSDGKAILLLDGLDETIQGDRDETAQESYNRVINAIMILPYVILRHKL